MGVETQIKGLLAELRGRYAIPRKKAADALVQLGSAAVPALIETLADKNPDVREAAANALMRIGTPEAREAVDKWRSSWT